MGRGKILIIHFRVGKTDGVSLEIANWKKILGKDGWIIEFAAGVNSIGADYVIDEFEQELDSTVYEIDNQAFGVVEAGFEEKLLSLQERLKIRFEEVIEKSKPDRIIVSNVFSVGLNLAAAGAMLAALDKFQIKTVAVHHDFYWENNRYDHPAVKLVEEQLDKYFPPKAGWLKHACINSIAKEELLKRKGIAASWLPDTLDYNAPNDDADSSGKEILKNHGVTDDDLVVLQATRIVRRKNIELAMDFVYEFAQRISQKVVFVMSGYAERRDQEYQNILRQHAHDLGINMVELNGTAKNFLGLYPYARVVTFPSEYEGFGNQFLEAVWAKKPVVMWEYPVFKRDIKPLGFEVVSLGDKLTVGNGSGLIKIDRDIISKAANEVIKLLADRSELHRIIQKNFEIAKRNFSFEECAQKWDEMLR